MISSKKIVLIGHFGVGKSSLIRRFVENIFSEEYKVTIGVHIFKKVIQVEGKNLTFVIWDIEGKEDITEIRRSYLLGTSGFIYVFDPTRKNTYSTINQDVEFCKTNYPTAKLITVANKLDLIDEEEFVSKIDFEIDYFTSAKTNKNVDLIFNDLGLKFLNDK
ncbi:MULTISPECIES: Rab family GTPase [Flavobacterium]|uniref:Rab family GTPase n=1 Tax=Flavobacterium jumunjinense TaxID=998845 RepID=A0ABV5GU84_9FLAO|nr:MULTISPECIES: Rab family GTPase [Flavobacterium]